MSDLYVRDTKLYTCTGRLLHFTLSNAGKMKRERPSGRNGRVEVRVVSKEEMEKLWEK